MKKFLRAIYNIIPLKQPLFKLLRVFHPNDKITRHLVFTGVIDVKMNSRHFKMYNKGYFLEQLFFWKGLDEWERYSSHLWRALSSHSKVVFDIGANSGVYTLMTKTINPAATVYSFEPINRIFTLLQKNVELNGFKNVHLLNRAVSNHVGVMQINDVADGNLYEASLEQSYIDNLTYDKSKFIKQDVAVDTIDHFIMENKIDSVDLMKIDVETHEPKVLEGMQKCLKEYKPILLIEILNKEVADKINKWLTNGAYLLYNINEEKGYECVESLSSSSHFNYVICPVEKEDILKRAMTKAQITLV